MKVARPGAPKSGGTARASAQVATWTLVSRLTGLVRVATIAGVLGPTYFGNLYQSANLLPNLVFELLAGPLFASLLVPVVVRFVDSGERKRIERFVGGFLSIVFLTFLAGVLLVGLAGQLVIGVLTVGVDDPSVVADQQRVGWLLLALLLPQVFCYALIGCCVAVQNAHGRYALPAAAPAFENMGIVGVLLGYAFLLGGTTNLSQVGGVEILWLGIGTTGAVALHAVAQWIGARGVGIVLRPRWWGGIPEVREIVRLAIPSAGYAGFNAARLFGVLTFASSIPGAVVAFQLAYNFYTLTDALIGRPIAQATLPVLSRAHASGNADNFRRKFSTAFSSVVFFALPVAVTYFLMAGQIGQAVSFGNMASEEGSSLVAEALMGLSLGAIGIAGVVLGTHASYARLNARFPAVVIGARSALTLGSIGLLLAVSGSASLFELGLVLSLTDLFAAALFVIYLGRARIFSLSVLAHIGRGVAAVAVMVLVVGHLLWLMDIFRVDSAILQVVLCAPLGVLIFWWAQWVLAAPQLSSMAAIFRKRTTGAGR